MTKTLDVYIGELCSWPESVYVIQDMTSEIRRYIPVCDKRSTPWNIEHERGVQPALARFEALNAGLDKLRDENAKLRELVRDMWKSCPVYTADCYGCKLYDRMRELGIEV